MSIFGNFIVENQYEDSDLDVVFEDTLIEQSVLLVEGGKLPKELNLDISDIISASKFKSKTKKILDYMKNEGFTDKQISNNVSMWYFYIIGNIFAENVDKYEPRMGYYFDLVNKYCTDKKKTMIRKDVEKTIPAIEKYKTKNENSKKPKDISKNLAYLDDIRKNISKLK